MNQIKYKQLNQEHTGILLHDNYFLHNRVLSKAISILLIAMRKEYSYQYLARKVFLTTKEEHHNFLKALLVAMEGLYPRNFAKGLIRPQDIFLYDDDHWVMAVEASGSIEDESGIIIRCNKVEDYTIGKLVKSAYILHR